MPGYAQVFHVVVTIGSQRKIEEKGEMSMQVFEVSIAIPGQAAETLTIQDERSLDKLSTALVDNGFITTEEVRVVWTGIEYQGRTNEYSAVEPVGEIALYAGSVLFIRRLELET